MTAVTVQNLANTPNTTPLVNKDTGNVTYNWNQWFTNVQLKINVINGVLVQIAGAGTVSGTFNLLSPLTTNGDLLTYNASNNTRLGIGTAGQVLTVVSGLPTWQSPTNYTTLPSAITVGASPFVFQNTSGYDADVLTTGGTVSLIEFSRDGTTYYAAGSISGSQHLSPLDRVRVTWTVAPVMTFIPR